MDRVSKIGFVIAGSIVLLAVLSPLLASWDKVQSQDLGARLDPPERTHLMGRDQLGRDLMARIIYGARISVLVGFSVVAISSIAGVLRSSGLQRLTCSSSRV
jgi:peptide/nickel transport system permease protein